MNNNECRYCGVPLSAETDTCQSCQFSITQNQNRFSGSDNQNQTTPYFNHQENVNSVSFDNSFQQSNFSSPETTLYSQKPERNQQVNNQNQVENQLGNQPNFYQQAQFPNQNFENQHQNTGSSAEGRRYGNCLSCQAMIHPSRVYCSRCLSQPAPVTAVKGNGRSIKSILSFILLLIFLGNGVFYLYNNYFSANQYLSKYDSVTGGGNSAVLPSFSIKGTATINVMTNSEAPVNPTNFIPDGGFQSQSFSFEMFFKKPDKIMMDYYTFVPDKYAEVKKSLVKQGFNGVKGWKLENLPNQRPSLVESNERMSEEHLVAGLGNYNSAQILTEAQKNSYPKVVFSILGGVNSISADGKTITVGQKVFLHVRKNNFKKGFNEAVLAFDESSGFLIGSAEKIVEDGKISTFLIVTDNYRKTFVKENGFFGLRSKTVLMPHLWNMRVIPSDKDSLQVLVKLDIQNFETDIPIDDSIFEKPVL